MQWTFTNRSTDYTIAVFVVCLVKKFIYQGWSTLLSSWPVSYQLYQEVNNSIIEKIPKIFVEFFLFLWREIVLLAVNSLSECKSLQECKAPNCDSERKYCIRQTAPPYNATIGSDCDWMKHYNCPPDNGSKCIYVYLLIYPYNDPVMCSNLHNSFDCSLSPIEYKLC